MKSNQTRAEQVRLRNGRGRAKAKATNVLLATAFTAGMFAMPVSNATAGDFKIGIEYESYERDVEQDGATPLVRFTETTDFSPTETFTEVTDFAYQGLDGEQEQENIFLSLSWAVTPKIEIYGKAGATKTKLTSFGSGGNMKLTESETFTEDGQVVFSESNSIYPMAPSEINGGQSHLGWNTTIGARMNLVDFDCGWGIDADTQYSYGEDKSKQTFIAAIPVLVELGDNDLKEWRSTARFARREGKFRPYFGISYADYTSSIKTDTTCIGCPPSSPGFDVDSSGGRLKFSNKDRIGGFGGFSWAFDDAFGVNLEARGGDQAGANLKFTYGF
jgi:hypothetical protein